MRSSIQSRSYRLTWYGSGDLAQVTWHTLGHYNASMLNHHGATCNVKYKCDPNSDKSRRSAHLSDSDCCPNRAEF